MNKADQRWAGRHYLRAVLRNFAKAKRKAALHTWSSDDVDFGRALGVLTALRITGVLNAAEGAAADHRLTRILDAPVSRTAIVVCKEVA